MKSNRFIIGLFLCILLLIGTVSADAFSAWTASGDSWVSTNDTYTVRMWNATGLHTFTTPILTISEYLVIGGGGATGRSLPGNGGAGGAGAGGFQNGTNLAVSGTITIFVGNGGTASTSAGSMGTNGINSSLMFSGTTINATGGGAASVGGAGTAASGGSGGGGGFNGRAGAAGNYGAYNPVEGYAGANGGNPNGGAGGGAGSAGSGTTAGSGRVSSITGTAITYAKGGAGGVSGVTYSNALSGTGNGGDGEYADLGGRNGGSGVVILKYPTPPFPTFTPDTNGGEFPLTVSFTIINGLYSATSGNWDYGDGTWYNWSGGSAHTDPHTYSSRGSYQVTYYETNLTYTDLPYTHSPNITVANQTTASFTKNVSSGYATLPVLFTSTSINATGFNWSFGDGTWSNGTAPTVTKSYINGNYTPYLISSDSGIGISTSASQWVNVTANGYTQKDLIGTPVFSLTLHITDSSNGAPIPIVNVVTSNSQVSTTTNGTAYLTFPFSTAVVYLTATGYASKSASYVMDIDRTESIQLTPSTETNSNQIVQYQAHQVRIRCLDYNGNPLENVAISAIGVESTISSYTWITDILGINLDATPIHNTTMNGTTGSDGSAVFLMLESTKYKIDFTSVAASVSQTSYLYPKEDNYDFIFWTESPRLSSTSIKIQWWNATNITNPTYMDLGVKYTDTGSSTNSLVYTISDENSNIVYNQTSSTPNSWNISYPILKERGKSYLMTIRANSTWYAQPIKESNVILFSGSPGIPFDLGTEWNNWISIAIIAIAALLFGRASLKYAMAIVPLLALMFAYIGWLQISGLMIAAVGFFGILFYIRFAEQESDV